MSDTSLVLFDPSRGVITGLQLPEVPPSRITIAGHSYKIEAPRAILPPIINVAKLILKWVGPASRTAANILHAKVLGGTGVTSDPATLFALANQVMTSWAAANMQGTVAANWSLTQVVAKDCGGTSATGISNHAGIPGVASGTVHPPGVSMCVSWGIAESYRGGKPRTYMPGVPTSANSTAGDSAIDPTFAALLDSHATAFLASINTATVVGSTVTLGAVSYYTGHSVRPTPLFRTFIDVKVHERLDSQRRRNGKESAFLVTP